MMWLMVSSLLMNLLSLFLWWGSTSIYEPISAFFVGIIFVIMSWVIFKELVEGN